MDNLETSSKTTVVTSGKAVLTIRPLDVWGVQHSGAILEVDVRANVLTRTTTVLDGPQGAMFGYRQLDNILAAVYRQNAGWTGSRVRRWLRRHDVQPGQTLRMAITYEMTDVVWGHTCWTHPTVVTKKARVLKVSRKRRSQ